MKHQKIAKTTLIVVSLLLLAATPAWASAQSSTEAAQTEATEVAAETSAAGEEAESEKEATGLDIVMDGTSLEAWEKSMEEVKRVGGPADYAKLSKAFDYLLAFDIGAKNDPEVLASRLNGLTGNQILKRVGYGRGKK